MYLLAYNYFNLGSATDTANQVLGVAGGLFSDLSPVWELVLGVGVALLAVAILFKLLTK